tara:strand:- start:14085 stop:15260 length:1176 start_codon:yes stop_codon:yes gene_type:complete
MKPTVIGSERRSTITEVAAPPLPMVPMNTGAVVLGPDQEPKAREALQTIDFESMPSGEVIRIGLDAEQALQRTLDGFLARLDKKSATRVFALFDRLEKGVDDAKLPEILDRIENGEKPGLLGSLFGKLRGKDVQDMASELMEEIGDMVAGRTRTLADELGKLETELSAEMQRLFSELQQLDVLKKSYAEHFGDFTVAAAVSRALLENAKTEVAAAEAKSNPADVVEQGRLSELRDKLRLLESRALALEGTYTRLPADQMVIQQIEQAGIATLQETATTVASRFASIKMTLLSIHGAFAVKSVQQMAGRQEKLDRQLTEIRGRALKDVAVTAATAPGDNRLAQAQQIEQIIATTKEIHGLVATARKSTEEKFDQARQKLAAARQDLAVLASS